MMAKQFKEVLDENTLYKIAKDVCELLSEMESSPRWTETLKAGRKQYAATHSMLEQLAFDAAFYLHIFWILGEYKIDIIPIPISTLVEQVGNSVISSSQNYKLKAF